jgi:hypothetical protein
LSSWKVGDILSASVIYLEDERLLRSYDRIGIAIVDYINEKDLSWEIEIARRVYFGKYLQAADSSRMNISYKPFIQWLIFSYKLHNGKSLIECVSDSYTKDAGLDEREALTSLKNTFESLFKVYSVCDCRIIVKDMFSANKYCIWDALLASRVKRYSGIFSRIVSINNKNIPIPGYSIMSNSFLKDTHKYINDKFQESYYTKKNKSIEGFIKDNSLLLHRYLLYYDI